MVKRFIRYFTLAVALLLTILLVRTLMYTNLQRKVEHIEIADVPLDAAVDRLSRAIQFATVSHFLPPLFNYEPFLAFHSFLGEAFPLIHEHLSVEVVNNHSLLFTWTGSNSSLKPMMFIAHMDVVPVEERSKANWTHPPFSGSVSDGFVWGRGTMDDKSGLMAALEAVEYLLSKGYKPQRTVYLGFGHDEEIDGQNGARKIAELLESRGVELEFLLDEGLPIIDSILEGTNIPTALIAIAEKGYLSLELSINENGGHSSMPPDRTAIGLLSEAIFKIEQNPMPGQLTGIMKKTFDNIMPDAGFIYRFMFANLWLFRPIIEHELGLVPQTNAVLRTTMAPTVFTSGVRDNVLPTHASAIINFRIHPSDNIGKVKEHIRNVIDDDRIKITILDGMREPSSISNVNGIGYRILERSVREVFSNINVAPSLMLANTDALHYKRIARDVYRFRPLRTTATDMNRVHGIDERVSIENYREMINFYIQVFRHASEKRISQVLRDRN